jgi:ATP-dependent DNA helicase RecG
VLEYARRGLDDVEKQEEKLANAVASSIEPQPTVQLEIVTHEDRDLLLLRGAYAAGPFFIRERGKEKDTFVRIGSNSLPASPEKVAELERARRMGAWDQEPMPGLTRDDLDRQAIKRWLDVVGERPTDAKLRGLGVLAEYSGPSDRSRRASTPPTSHQRADGPSAPRDAPRCGRRTPG